MRRFAEPISSANEGESAVPDSIIKLVEAINKTESALLENLSKATTPEQKTAAATAFKTALGGDRASKTLLDLIDAVNKAETPVAKEAAMQALKKALSPDGDGRIRTAKLLHDETKELKASVAGETREKEAKEVLRTIGDVGLTPFINQADGTLKRDELSAILGLKKDEDKNSIDALAAGLGDRGSRVPLRPAPLTDASPTGPQVPLRPGVLTGGNPSPTPTPTASPATGPQPTFDPSIVGDGGAGTFDPSDERARADADLAERARDDANRAIEEALRAAQDARDEAQQNRDREINAKSNAGDQQEQPSSPSSGGGGSGGGSGSGAKFEPPNVNMPQPKIDTAFPNIPLSTPTVLDAGFIKAVGAESVDTTPLKFPDFAGDAAKDKEKKLAIVGDFNPEASRLGAMISAAGGLGQTQPPPGMRNSFKTAGSIAERAQAGIPRSNGRPAPRGRGGPEEVLVGRTGGTPEFRAFSGGGSGRAIRGKSKLAARKAKPKAGRKPAAKRRARR